MRAQGNVDGRDRSPLPAIIEFMSLALPETADPTAKNRIETITRPLLPKILERAPERETKAVEEMAS